MTCGICACSCPVSGVDGFDPRKVVRMAAMGLERELVESRWPWICTMCGKCENACPMEVRIADVVRRVRSLRDRDRVPGILHKGLQAALETGNNLRLPKEDYLFILEDVAGEIREEPGFEGFRVDVDKKGARVLTTIHNKLVNTHTEDLKHWWKIFHDSDKCSASCPVVKGLSSNGVSSYMDKFYVEAHSVTYADTNFFRVFLVACSYVDEEFVGFRDFLSFLFLQYVWRFRADHS